MKYFEDPYVEKVFLALNDLGGKTPIRRSPIIHRGYYARYESFTRAMNKFLSKGSQPKQIVFLGSGFDTLPLVAYNQSGCKVTTFDVDFQEVMHKKAEVFSSIPEIVSLLNTEESLPMISPQHARLGAHTFIGQDLRNGKGVVSALSECGLDCSLPTLILSECVLVYMTKDGTMSLCSELGQYLQSEALWMTYDMITPNDIYGRNMIRNLQGVGFEIPGIKDFPTLEDQKNRFLHTNWTEARACTMRQYYDALMQTTDERERLFKLEILDEVEEWNMLMDHYALTIAAKGVENDTVEDILSIIV